MGALPDTVRAALEEARNPADAEPMQAYMKSAMPFLGVKKPARTKALRPIFGGLQLATEAELAQAVLELWEAAEFREERYAALELLDLPRHRKLHRWPLCATVQRLVVEGAWWDLVDACSRPIGNILAAEPAQMRVELYRWAAGDDLWLRRSAVIAQLRFRERLDFPLLEALIESALSSPGLQSPLPLREQRFFLHKGAGWALRTHARVAPDEVRGYLERNPNLPALTRREAAKHLA